jgi:hypothetical protein
MIVKILGIFPTLYVDYFLSPLRQFLNQPVQHLIT